MAVAQRDRELNTNAVFEAATLAEHAHTNGRIGQTVGAEAARNDGKPLGFVCGRADLVTTDHHEVTQALDLGGGEFGYRERRRLGCKGDLGERRGQSHARLFESRPRIGELRLDERLSGVGLINFELSRVFYAGAPAQRLKGAGLRFQRGEIASHKLARFHPIMHMMRARAAGTRVTGFAANIQGVVQNIIGAMQRLHANRNLSFVVDISADLTVNCDEGDLAEILSNLIDNACKWAQGNIKVAARLADGKIFIDVADDGPGIADDMRDKVFDVGARLDEGKAGSGLGLAIARDLARLYGGDLELEKAPAGGLLARLLLPDINAKD